MNNIEKISCMYLNATSLDNKFDEFKLVVATYNPKIISITETWFKPNSLCNLEGYCLYKKDRCDGCRGGGVCIYIDAKITSYELNDNAFTLSQIEHVWAVIQFGNDKYLIGCIYRPYDFTDMTDIKNVFKNAREYVDQKGFKDLIIVGDFNFPGISWSNGSINSIKGSSDIEHVFYQIINDNYLYQHREINFYIEKQIIKRKADSISSFLTSVDWLQCFHAKNVQEMYDELIHYTEEACNLYVPINTLFVNSSSKNPWLTKELISLIREKRNLRYRNCLSKWKNSNLCKQYKELSKRVSFEISIARRKYELMIVDKAKKNPKLLYRYMNSQQYVKDSIKALRQPNGEITQDSEKIADLLNINFQNVFVKENNKRTPLFKNRINDNTFNLSSEDIHYDDVLERLNNLDQNKAYRVDKLHPSILKNCAIAFALPLTIIFMESIEKSQLPNQFNSANITALYKKGDKTDSGNYRPISLPSFPIKFPISKLKAYGVSGLALDWFRAFLSNRRQRVVIGDYVSTWAEVHSGVPQDSVLGPLLFILYINDLPESDDTKIMSISSSDELHNKLQCDLNSAYAWKQDWLLSFNIEKCLVMHYGYKNKRYPIYINVCKLNTSERDLGVIFSDNLMWKNQVLSSASKANRMLGIIKKSFVRFDAELLKSLYLSFVRPLLEFAIPLELYNYIFKGYDKVEFKEIYSFKSNCTHGHSLKYSKEFSVHKYRDNNLLNRAANYWIALPENIVRATSTNSFKAKLDRWESNHHGIQLS
nr:uncharacterized protein LOC124806737 [Hydra vulgaris]